MNSRKCPWQSSSNVTLYFFADMRFRMPSGPSVVNLYPYFAIPGVSVGVEILRRRFFDLGCLSVVRMNSSSLVLESSGAWRGGYCLGYPN